jgi:ABC-type dipeptide/oligopeptide/nickel transport system permease subunit
MRLGGDAYGRDNFSRLLYGGRATLAAAGGDAADALATASITVACS